MAQQPGAKGGGPRVSPNPDSPASKKYQNVKDMAGRQKAAVFLVSLGSDISAEIFKHLRED